MFPIDLDILHRMIFIWCEKNKDICKKIVEVIFPEIEDQDKESLIKKYHEAVVDLIPQYDSLPSKNLLATREIVSRIIYKFVDSRLIIPIKLTTRHFTYYMN